MDVSVDNIISHLRKEIAPLHKLCIGKNEGIDIGFSPVQNAFPNHTFPIAAIHEFISSSLEDTAATVGFISVLLSKLIQHESPCIWIGPSPLIFPVALSTFNIQPDNIIFITVKNTKELLWVTEEALKCDRLSAVIADIKDIDFKQSRRLQLVVETSKVTGFLLRQNPRDFNTIASVSRWRITSLPCVSEDDLPGVGFPAWNVELLKVRNGKPNNWQVQYTAQGLQTIHQNSLSITGKQLLKTG